VEVALVLNELRDSDVLDRDRVVWVGGDHRVSVGIILGDGQQGLEIRSGHNRYERLKRRLLDCLNGRRLRRFGDRPVGETENMLATWLTVT
jgi:hypothetical protein